MAARRNVGSGEDPRRRVGRRRLAARRHRCPNRADRARRGGPADRAHARGCRAGSERRGSGAAVRCGAMHFGACGTPAATRRTSSRPIRAPGCCWPPGCARWPSRRQRGAAARRASRAGEIATLAAAWSAAGDAEVAVREMLAGNRTAPRMLHGARHVASIPRLTRDDRRLNSVTHRALGAALS